MDRWGINKLDPSSSKAASDRDAVSSVRILAVFLSS